MSIKKVLFGTAVAVSVAAFGLVSCGGSQTASPQAQQGGGGGGKQSAQSGGSWDLEDDVPCQMYGDEEYYAATGMASGSQNQRGNVQRNAMTNARQVIRENMAHAYEGMVSDYMNTLGNNQGNDIRQNLETGGDQIMNLVVNAAEPVCGPKFTKPDAGGRVECFVAVKISKSDAARKIAAKVEDVVSDDEEATIRFNEFKFREKLEKKFQEFKEKK